METLKTNLLEIFYAHVEEVDWLEGLNLYQAGKVNQLTDYSGLITAKVKSHITQQSEVRLKIHPSGKRIQWIECTCPKYRSTGRYCEHMAAFMINIDREKPQMFGNLDGQMPLKPPASAKRTKISQPTRPNKEIEKLEGAAQTILTHLKGNIHSVSLMAKGPNIRVRIEIKPGTITHYNLDLDSAAKFLQAHPRLKSASEDIRSLKVYNSKVLRGTRFHYEDGENIVAERVLVIRHTPKSMTKVDPDNSKLRTTLAQCKQFSDENPKGMQGTYEFIPIKSGGRFIGKEFIFIPSRGYWPLATLGFSTEWFELPLRKVFKGDQAANLIQSGFKEYLSNGYIWLEDALGDPKITQDLAISEIRIHKAAGGWFHLDPKYTSGETTISMVDLMKQSRQQKRNFLKSGDTWLKIPEFVKDHEWDVDPTGKYIRVNAIGLFRLKAAIGDFDQFVGSKTLLNKIRNQLEFHPGEDLPALKETNLELRSYQDTGLKWLWWLYKNNLHGLLADEMGLGKTHQAMAVLSAIKSQNPNANFIVIAPTTVIDHWIDKINQYSPALNPVKHHGAKRIQSLEQHQKGCRTIVTSYGVLLRDIKAMSQIPFETIILDEAHFIKNNITATYKSVCRLDGRFRICLTGTPLENHLGELKNLFDFLMPGYLGSDEYFKKNFLVPIEAGSQPESELALQKLIHPFKMRRTKENVLKDLPEKVEDYRTCELSKEQVKMYRNVIQMKASPIVKQLENDDSPVPYLHVFHTLTLLKQICNHPALVDKKSDYQKHESGKFETFKTLLDEALDSGHKVVVYSQYVGMIKIFEHYLKSKKIDHAILTGQSRKRGEIIARFQNDPNCLVFCGSLLAGGIGIDLTSASVVIHYDRWWNASKENQATDRVHRIGQNKNVQVLKLMTKGTLEEKIDALIRSKQSVFEKFLDRDEEIFKKLDRKQLIELLS